MTTLLVVSPSALEHQTSLWHPERQERVRAVERALEEECFTWLVREHAWEVALETVALAHPEPYIRTIIDTAPQDGLVEIDADTTMSRGTVEAALRAAGAALQAVDEVMTGKVVNAFSALRPPGHHAGPARAMGFCLFNNVAIAARYAQEVHGAERVAIVDWDVHHGNGTQDIFWSNPSVLFCSTHQMPLYPGTGAISERGEHDTVVNAPLRPGDGSDTFREVPPSCPELRSSGQTSFSYRPGSTLIGAIRWETFNSRRRTSPGLRESLWISPIADAAAGWCRYWKAATT